MRRSVLLLLLLVPALSSAQTPQTVDWTRGIMLKGIQLSFAGAYRALADGNAAILYNPAGMAQRQGTVGMGGEYAHVGVTHSTVIGASVVDGQAIPGMAVGVSYDRDNPTIGGIGTTVQQVTLGAAMTFDDLLFIGATTKGYFTSVNSAFQDSPSGIDGDLGLLIKPIPMVSFALTGQNVIQGGNRKEFPTILGVGIGLTLPPYARLAIDLEKDFATDRANGMNGYFGAELRATEGVFLRGGFGLDRVRDNNFYAVGAALVGPKVSLVFAFSERLNPTSEVYAANVELYF
ncbi:MAG: hypothetical protein V1495_00965 [Pseudomonadota bacterium]